MSNGYIILTTSIKLSNETTKFPFFVTKDFKELTSKMFPTFKHVSIQKVIILAWWWKNYWFFHFFKKLNKTFVTKKNTKKIWSIKRFMIFIFIFNVISQRKCKENSKFKYLRNIWIFTAIYHIFFNVLQISRSLHVYIRKFEFWEFQM